MPQVIKKDEPIRVEAPSASRPLSMHDIQQAIHHGWIDFRATKWVSMLYGMIFLLSGYAMVALTYVSDRPYLFFALFIGAMLAGPLFAVGVYDLSRQLEKGKEPTLMHSLRAMRSGAFFDVIALGFGLMLIMIFWMRMASVVHVLMPESLTLAEMLPFLAVGTVVGAVFCGLVFGITVFALPMMVHKPVDVVSASVASLKAVNDNKGVMIGWAFIVGICTVVGFATGLVGFLILFPFLAHATWHLYQRAFVI